MLDAQFLQDDDDLLLRQGLAGLSFRAGRWDLFVVTMAVSLVILMPGPRSSGDHAF